MLRQSRGWIVHAVVLALVLPVLAGLLPVPALSAAAALERDLAVSLCATAEGSQPDRQHQHPAQHDACIICAIGAALSGPHPGDAAVPALARTPGNALHPLKASPRLDPSLLRAGNPPRGPPSIPTV